MRTVWKEDNNGAAAANYLLLESCDGSKIIKNLVAVRSLLKLLVVSNTGEIHFAIKAVVFHWISNDTKHHYFCCMVPTALSLHWNFVSTLRSSGP